MDRHPIRKMQAKIAEPIERATILSIVALVLAGLALAVAMVGAHHGA